MGRVIDRRTFLIDAGRGAAGLVVLSSIQANDPWKALTDRLDKLVPALMSETKLPGLSLALIRDGQLLWRRAYGVKDAVSRAPVDHDTVFEAASMSKPVFAYAVMKLRERGLLDLDLPLTKYTTARFLEGDSRLELITARQILSHTAGFQNWRSDAAPLKIHFTPGERYQYSGEGYSYLQSVVTHLAGEPFDPFMRRLLLAPFGMEEGASVELPDDELGLVVGEPSTFRFFASTSRKDDAAGALVDPDAAELTELDPVEQEVEASGARQAGDVVPVALTAHVTEVGTLELWCRARDGAGRWKLEYSVRER